MRPPTPDDDLPTLRALPVSQAQRDAATLWVWGQAKQGLDVKDPAAHRQAVAIAGPVLDALGLLGGREDLRPAAAANVPTSRFTHGTRSAVQEHQRAGTPLCKPCQRWSDVQARRACGVVFVRPVRTVGSLCGTLRRWQGHLDDKENVDPACAMYAEWFMSLQSVKPNGTGPLAEHVLPDSYLPAHLDGTLCGHVVTRSGRAIHPECTGRAGWKQECSCGWHQFAATRSGCNDLRVDHRRQVILRALAQVN